MSIAKKLKQLVKGEKPTFGTDPNDPWSAKANINESGLNSFLMAKGINPKFISKETKISHAKSLEFAKWKRDHQFEEVEYINEDKYLDAYLLSKGLNPKMVTKDQKIAHAKSAAFLTWKKNHLHEQVFHHSPTQSKEHMLKKKAKHGTPIQTEEVDEKDTITLDIPLMIRVLEYAREDAKDDMALHKVVEKLIDIRSKGTLTMDDYDFIVKLKEEFELTEGKMKDIVTDREEKSRLSAHERGGADAWYGRKYSNPHEVGSIEHKAYHQGYHGGEKGGKDYGTSKGAPQHSFRESALDKFREKAAERAKKHDEIEKKRKEAAAQGKTDVSGAIDRLEKALNKEESEFMKDVKKKVASNKSDKYSHYSKTDKEQGREVSSKLYGQMAKYQSKLAQEETANSEHSPATHAAVFHDENGRLSYVVHFHAENDKHAQAKAKTLNVLQRKDGKEDTLHHVERIVKEEVEQIDELNYDTVKSLYDKRRDDYRGDKVGETKKGKKVSAKNVGTSISRLMGFKPTQNKPEPKNEEVEQIDELKKSTVKSWLSKQDVIPPKKPGMDRKAFNKRVKTRSASWDRALDRMTGHKPTSEDVYQDSQAATQTCFDGANAPDNTEPQQPGLNRKREMSKSARIIKSIYNKLGMVKEELYDHEKEDKSVATYGKKPKLQQVDTEKLNGDNAPEASAVLSGGKTLTGQSRDTLEIDPQLKRPIRSGIKKQ